MERKNPIIKNLVASMGTWIEDWESPKPGELLSSGVLLTTESSKEPMSDSSASVRYKVCATYPDCGLCTENKDCPISKEKI